MKLTAIVAAIVATAALAVAILATTAERARAQSQAPVTTLTDEQLHACRSGFFLGCDPSVEHGDLRIRSRCTSPETGTVSWKATAGLASGPYPGSFTEKGRAEFTNGQLTSVAVRFHIDSALGVVEGRKFLPRPFFRAGLCYDTGLFGPEVFPGGALRYEATITPPTGCRYADEGQAGLHMFGANAEGPFVAKSETTIGFLSGGFGSDLLSARPAGCPDEEGANEALSGRGQ
jgi:hypothetical protein